MVHLANPNGISETPLPIIPHLDNNVQRTQKRVKTVTVFSQKAEDSPQHWTLLQTTRRVALGLASVALIGSSGKNGVSLAEENKYWIDGPIPVPPIFNNISNEKTGTRSFVRSGIYMANIGVKGSMYRLKKYAFDLLALGDLIGQDAWNYIRKYLRLKGTFMYYDFDKVISAAPVADKQPLTDLANRLFDNVEKLEEAVKKHDLTETKSYYQDTSVILQEVMTRMA